MANLSVKGISQVALYAPDPDRLAQFYKMVLGLKIVVRGKINAEGIRSSVFLNSSAQTSYQLAIFSNPDIQFAAFEVASLTKLKAIHGAIIEAKLRIRWMLNHGVALALYFHDPANNLIKVFWSTGIEYPQPYSHPIDLGQSKAFLQQDLLSLVERLKQSEGGDSELEDQE